MTRLAWAILVGVAAGLVGYWIGAQLATGGPSDAAVFVGYVAGATGFIMTLGFAPELLSRLRGRPSATVVHRPGDRDSTEYFRISLDHKIVGVQFALGIGLLALVGVLLGVF